MYAKHAVILFFILFLSQYLNAQGELNLWYKKPATTWTEALPLGNGRLGAMIFGGVEEELIQLNEETLWSGGPVKENVNPGAYENLQLARKALFEEEDYTKANAYAKKMQGYYSESYLPLGDLKIKQDFGDGQPSSYKRSLDIKRALATTSFKINGITYTREIFVSAPDQVIAIKLTASKPKALNLVLQTSSPLPFKNLHLTSDMIAMRGKAPAHVEPNYVQADNPIIFEDSTGCDGIRYDLRLKVHKSDGTVFADQDGLHIQNASETIVYLTAGTSFNGYDKCPESEGKDEQALVEGYLAKAEKQNWKTLLKRHITDYQQFFNRVDFTLDEAENIKKDYQNKSTLERLIAYAKGNIDLGLETLYYQYGRYLLISSSRPGGTPANLQGIWNKEVRPPWSSNFTTNINAQMNYWPAEMTNLSEMHLPFLDFIEDLSVAGEVTAKQFYHAKGWAVHHNSDIWALTNPVGNLGDGDPMWANWPMGSPWLSQHLWWHYQYTQDRGFLKNTAYPIMKGAAAFCLDWLVENDQGQLVTAPSGSPENAFIDEYDKRGTISIASTMDMSIIWDLFTNTIEASEALNIDADFRENLEKQLTKLFPLQIGKKGDIQEWYKDWEAEDPHHRHVSQLFGLFPGRQISPISTPKLAEAARKTLELRGDGGTGWSLAWKINFWARLQDGDHAYKMLRNLLHLTGQKGTDYADGGGTYANLFDAHPPFQIDGNFGGVSGMTQLLLQSYGGEIQLLPALPMAWPSGQIKGLKARGNFEVNVNWEAGKLTGASLKSVMGGAVKLRTGQPIKILGIATKSIKAEIGFTTDFSTEAGKKYQIRPEN